MRTQPTLWDRLRVCCFFAVVSSTRAFACACPELFSLVLSPFSLSRCNECFTTNSKACMMAGRARAVSLRLHPQASVFLACWLAHLLMVTCTGSSGGKRGDLVVLWCTLLLLGLLQVRMPSKAARSLVCTRRLGIQLLSSARLYALLQMDKDGGAIIAPGSKEEKASTLSLHPDEVRSVRSEWWSKDIQPCMRVFPECKGIVISNSSR